MSSTVLKSAGLTFCRMAYKCGSLVEGITKNDALPFPVREAHQEAQVVDTSQHGGVNLDNLILLVSSITGFSPL